MKSPNVVILPPLSWMSLPSSLLEKMFPPDPVNLWDKTQDNLEMRAGKNTAKYLASSLDDTTNCFTHSSCDPEHLRFRDMVSGIKVALQGVGNFIPVLNALIPTVLGARLAYKGASGLIYATKIGHILKGMAQDKKTPKEAQAMASSMRSIMSPALKGIAVTNAGWGAAWLASGFYNLYESAGFIRSMFEAGMQQAAAGYGKRVLVGMVATLTGAIAGKIISRYNLALCEKMNRARCASLTSADLPWLQERPIQRV